MMINRFLLFMKMFLTGLFKFIVGVVMHIALIFGIVIIADTIAKVEILKIILLIVLIGVAGLLLFLITNDFWDRYKRERDFRGL